MIDKSELEKIARLSRLEIPEKEYQKTMDRFTDMLAYMENIQKIDLSGVEPMTRVEDSGSFLREDKQGTSFQKEDTFRNAPSFDQNHFTVPKVIG